MISFIPGRYISVDESNYEGVCELILEIACPKRPLTELGLQPLPDGSQVPTGLFNTICADGGPLGGSLGDILPKEICNLDTTAAYRGDRKGDIESSFHAYLVQCAKDLPGFNRVDRFAGHAPADAVACLTLKEFEDIFDAWLLQYNRRALDRFLPADALRLPEDQRPNCNPADLYAWGLAEKTGFLRSKPEHELRKSLLRRTTGTLRPRDGIKFKGLHYLLDNDPLQYRFQSREVEIRYSNRHCRQIFVWLDGECHTASLRRDLDQELGTLSFPEVTRHRKHASVKKKIEEAKHRKLKIASRGRAEEIAGKARKAMKALYPDAKSRKAAINGSSREKRRKSALAKETAATSSAVADLFGASKNCATAFSPRLKKRSMRELRESNSP